MTEWQRSEVAVRLTIEQLTMFASGDWRRKVDYTEEIPVPEQEWDEYHEAVAARDHLLSFNCVYDACGIEIEEPRPRTVFHYAETEEAWEARVRAKLDAGEQPDNRLVDPFIQDVFTELLYDGPLAAWAKADAKVQGLGKAVDYSFRRPPQAGWTTEDQRASRGGTFAPNAQVVASHIREQISLDVFKKECDD